jgi:hypothetical protein
MLWNVARLDTCVTGKNCRHLIWYIIMLNIYSELYWCLLCS